MLLALSWIDHSVVLIYLACMLSLGLYWGRRRQDDEEYFLAGRRMPWLAVGISVIASILSSLTYMFESGEVWKSGLTHVAGKLLAIPFEMVFVWLFLIPFLMRFRYTSVYEYLGDRFGQAARRLGVALFILMVVLWMGFVVLASSKALAQVSDVPLWVVLTSVGLVATIYTMLGGLRAVIWTDVIQVVLLVGGGLYTIGFVAVVTGTWLPDWYAVVAERLQVGEQAHALPLFHWSPFVRATVITVAVNMAIWHICTHSANQMTVQRYFSTQDVRAARRSFVTGSLLGVGINIMLAVVGLALVYFYYGQGIAVDQGLDPAKQSDLIFPTFAVTRLPAGLGGAILAALLAAAMSSIDSGVNSIATVLSVEMRVQPSRNEDPLPASATTSNDHVKQARIITLGCGLFITAAAYALSFMPAQWGILEAIPRTFNAVTGPLGALFLMGIFLPFVRQRAAVAATFCGIAVSIVMGYFQQLMAIVDWAGIPAFDLLKSCGIPTFGESSISFTWIMPCSLVASLVVAVLLSPFDKSPSRSMAGLTWFTRKDKPCKNSQDAEQSNTVA